MTNRARVKTGIPYVPKVQSVREATVSQNHGMKSRERQLAYGKWNTRYSQLLRVGEYMPEASFRGGHLANPISSEINSFIFLLKSTGVKVQIRR